MTDTLVPTPAPTPAPGIIGSQIKFVDYGGQQVLGMTPQKQTELEDSAKNYNATTGGNLTAQQYDASLNKDTWQARWNADGTPKMAGDNAETGSHFLDRTKTTTSAQPQGIIASAAAPAMQAWNVTPEQTVEGRIQSIINPNNPIIAQARGQAVDAMNQRGLTNSSIATTAADAAAYQAAIPIAQADAATAAKSAGYNADINNQATLRGREIASQEGIVGRQLASTESIAHLNSDTQKAVAGLQGQNQLIAQQMQNDNQKLLQTNGNAAQAFNTAMSAINNIQGNDKMDATTKTQAIAQVWADVQRQLATLGAVSGLNLTSQLNFANMPGFDANGVYVGFTPAPTPAPAPAPTTDDSSNRY